jgi:predicted cupin superfamily sugar epimerase
LERAFSSVSFIFYISRSLYFCQHFVPADNWVGVKKGCADLRIRVSLKQNQLNLRVVKKRVQELIDHLQLQAHPEGGYYAETYRSTLQVETDHGSRSLMTCIYFLLTSANFSRFHQIKSDEMWFYHEGSPLTVHMLSDKGYEQLLIGPSDQEGHLPYQLVQSGVIFGSTVDQKESYSLVSCVVAPGFDFQDFKLSTTGELLEKWPEHQHIIHQLT